MALQPKRVKCRVEESIAERGTAEPFLRLHNLYSSPRCARQPVLPRPSRGALSQHSYPLNRFSSVPLDPMERPTSQADLELDYNPPRVQLSDEMFVFQDGRWVNESCRLQSPHCSPPASFHHKLHPGRLSKEHVLQEENKVLREENRVLREENKALRRENKILQVFWEEQKGPRGREDGAAPRTPGPALDAGPKEKDAGAQVPRSGEGSALQLLREENRALQQLLEHRQARRAQAEAKPGPAEGAQPAPAPHEEPPAAAFEELPGPTSAQDERPTLRALRRRVSNLAGPSGAQDGEGRPGPGLGDGGQALELLRDMQRALQALRDENQSLQVLRDENRLLHEENRALHVLRVEHRLFQEENKALWENNKLKLQQKLVIDTVTEVTARMEMLIEELYAFMPAKNKDLKKPSRV